MWSNRLKTLPDCLGDLRDLSKLDVSYNRLSTIPGSISNLGNLSILNLYHNEIITLPDKIGDLANLSTLDLSYNRLTTLPDSISNLSNLMKLALDSNRLACLLDSFGDLNKLTNLSISYNKLTAITDRVGNLTNLTNLNLGDNQLSILPDSVGKLVNLAQLNLSRNQLNYLPSSICKLINLVDLNLSNNPLIDLAGLQRLPKLATVSFAGTFRFPRRFWTKFSEWKAEWLLTENNTEIRRILIQQLGYEKICQELGAMTIDRWQEYTLLKIDDVERLFDRNLLQNVTEPMVLLKMTCPSTAHIHMLRVPPNMTSAEAAITWANHGIHPSKFSIET